ncbi:hypothetical protein PsorP6_017277 [Peronosclerospora sorghi]|uniref:Uncharacterized protein n=1 Tax=Peronosclerospora sorghi TaxID=230839 RepID=A0ACC0WNI7_9STRA|nr:hypothetical protein PsorP6_017277 [Peronosclerospora sorghi]
MVRNKVRAATNPGAINIKSQLQDVQNKIRIQDTQAVNYCRNPLDKATARYSDSTRKAYPVDNAKQRHLFISIRTFVSKTNSSILSSPITTSDLASENHHMKSTSAPGVKGLTAGLYQSAPDVFGECLRIVFNDRLLRGILLRLNTSRQSCFCTRRGLKRSLVTTDPLHSCQLI